jgi:transposase
VFTTCYSNYRYARLFARQDTLSFMESHVSFFARLGYVHPELIYDNMRVAVYQFTGALEKEPAQALLQYGFTHRFCNIRRGNEKGHVERSVEYVRRKSFGFKTWFGDCWSGWSLSNPDRISSCQASQAPAKPI